MFFVVLEKYCKDVLDCHAWDLLEINKSGWYRFQKLNTFTLEHCKTVSSHFNHHITDDFIELSLIIINSYKEVV